MFLATTIDVLAVRRLRELRTSPRGRFALYLAEVALVAGLYYGFARAGLELAYLHGTVTALWPPVGVGIAALALGGPRLFPGIVAGDLLVGDFSTPTLTVAGQTLGNTLEVVVAAVLLRRVLGSRIACERVQDVLGLVAFGAVGTAISASFGVVSLRLGDEIPGSAATEVWRTWFLADLSGVLVVTPFVLAWASRGLVGFGRRQLLEGAVLLAGLVALAEVPAQQNVPYIVFPLLIYAALRLGPRGAATAIAVISTLAVWNTAHDAGPFVRSSIDESLLASQLFVAVAALTSLVLAAVTAELRRAIERYEESEGVHRALAAEQAALRRIATLVAGEPDPGRVFEKVTEEVGRRLGVTTAFVLRYEEEAACATLVGAWSERGVLRFPIGSALPLDGDSVIAQVWRTREPERLESYDEAEGELAERLRGMGYRSSIGAPVKVAGRLWGVLVASSEGGPFGPGAERHLCDFADLVAQALANADAHEQLAASRARLVQAGDAERRRLERNLHDGAQQRLVSLAVQLRLVEGRIDSDPGLSRDLLQVAKDELDQALEDLRELARGIHPAILTDRGLGPALETLIARSPAPVEVLALPEERLPQHVEAAAYYIVAEALTNVAKYAQAQNVRVRVAREDGHAVVEVADDGLGGADTAGGSGLAGLADRVEALGGSFGVESPRGAGTHLTARIPSPA